MPKIKGPAIQWYYKQWLGDQKVLGMDWDANGMHFWLINLSLQEDPAGTIPNDMGLIRRWLRNPSDDVWRRVQPQIFNSWSLLDGRWHQKGVEETAQRQHTFSESRAGAANARWDKDRREKERREVLIRQDKDAYALRMQYENDALQSSTSSSKTKTKTTTPQAAFALPDWVPVEPWEAFVKMRTKQRWPLSDRAKQGIVRDLDRLRTIGNDIGEVLDRSEKNNWRGVFELPGAVPERRGETRYENKSGYGKARTSGNLSALEEVLERQRNRDAADEAVVCEAGVDRPQQPGLLLGGIGDVGVSGRNHGD